MPFNPVGHAELPCDVHCVAGWKDAKGDGQFFNLVVSYDRGERANGWDLAMTKLGENGLKLMNKKKKYGQNIDQC